MAWSITERFPVWGETGEFPTAGFFYEGGDQVNEKHFDALWNGVNGLEEDIQDSLDDIDGDADGVVDEADTANLYKGNDIDTNGDGKVNAAESADDADTVGGEAPSAFANTNHGNEEHSTSFTTLTEVNNNADVPNADFADTAGGLSGNNVTTVNSQTGDVTVPLDDRGVYESLGTFDITGGADINLSTAPTSNIILVFSGAIADDFIELQFNNDNNNNHVYRTQDSLIREDQDNIFIAEPDKIASGEVKCNVHDGGTYVNNQILSNGRISRVSSEISEYGSYSGEPTSVQITSQQTINDGDVEIFVR